MNIIKRQGIGTWITLGTILLSLIALIIYNAALGAGTGLAIASGSEMFYESTRPADSAMISSVMVCGVIALVLLVVAIVLSQFKFEGIVGKVCDCVAGACRIIAPALIMVAFLQFVYGSFTGLGWTFFSNAELEIYAEAIKVGKQVITGLIFFAIAAVAAIVASFFAITKKDAAAE